MRKRFLILLLLTVARTAAAQTLYEGFADPPRSAQPRVLEPAPAAVRTPAAEAAKKLTWQTREVEGPALKVIHFPDFRLVRDYEHVATLAVQIANPVVRLQDLSLIYEADGRLIWKVPQGRWRIYEFGASPSGQVTWTPDMMTQFRERRGYDLFPWLPALAGEVLSSPLGTGQFLFDWRKTLRELYGGQYERPDGMDLKRTAAIPSSVIRAGDGQIPAMAGIRESASVAHIFGQNLVAAEARTDEAKPSLYAPGSMKYTADVALSCGLNLFGYDPRPDRHEAWPEEAKAWTDYLARSSFLLQQGRYKADILYFYGEDNNISGLFRERLPDIPDGYSYDFIQPYGLEHAVFPIDGRLVTESGMHYRMLVLGPECRTMSFALLSRILYLAQSGVPVCGTFPEQAASLADNQESFDLLLRLLRPHFLDMPLAQALQQKGIVPDFVAPQGWAYVHRETDHEDIYWVRNFTGADASSVILVKGGPGQPRVLDPATGKVRLVNAYTSPDHYRYFQLDLAKDDARFVVIGKRPEQAVPVPPTVKRPVETFDGPWTLASYTESAHPAIRHYAGTVLYRKDFTLKKKQLRKVSSFEIDLGTVQDLARVTVNGHDLGVAWTAPFRLEVPAEYLHAGTNTLEVKVINLRPAHNIDTLQPAGLLGPVTLSALSGF